MDVEWKRDEVGQPALYMNARASCRDNARFGQLFLRRGCWNGERVLSEEWVEAATSSSTNHNRGYGYWWLSGEDPTLDSVDFEPKGPGGLHPFAPDDAFCAVGLGQPVHRGDSVPRHGRRTDGYGTSGRTWSLGGSVGDLRGCGRGRPTARPQRGLGACVGRGGRPGPRVLAGEPSPTSGRDPLPELDVLTRLNGPVDGAVGEQQDDGKLYTRTDRARRLARSASGRRTRALRARCQCW